MCFTIYYAYFNTLRELLNTFNDAHSRAIKYPAVCAKCECSKATKHKVVRKLFSTFTTGENDTKERPETLHHDHNIVSDKYINTLFLYSIIIIELIVPVFVSNYVYQKTPACSPDYNIHCFDTQQVYGDEVDCDNLTQLENVTSIVCYQLSLNMSHAVSHVLLLWQ